MSNYNKRDYYFNDLINSGVGGTRTRVLPVSYIKSFTSLVNFFLINKVRLLFYICLLKDGMEISILPTHS